MNITLSLAQGTHYIPLNADAQIRRVTVVPGAAPGAAGSVTITQDAVALAVASVIGVSAGVPVVATINATTGLTKVLAATKSLKIVVTSTNSVQMGVVINVDEEMTLK